MNKKEKFFEDAQEKLCKIDEYLLLAKNSLLQKDFDCYGYYLMELLALIEDAENHVEDCKELFEGSEDDSEQ